MHGYTRERQRRKGFTLVELMIVVTIIGTLASIAIPQFNRYQLRTKSAEVKANLASIRVAQEAHFSEIGLYLQADAEPAVIPGAMPGDFDSQGSDFGALGWYPEGRVYFSYAVEVTPGATGYTADAGADIDGNGVIQLWGYLKPDQTGDTIAGGIGCDPAVMTPELITSCIVATSSTF